MQAEEQNVLLERGPEDVSKDRRIEIVSKIVLYLFPIFVVSYGDLLVRITECNTLPVCSLNFDLTLQLLDNKPILGHALF